MSHEQIVRSQKVAFLYWGFLLRFITSALTMQQKFIVHHQWRTQDFFSRGGGGEDSDTFFPSSKLLGQFSRLGVGVLIVTNLSDKHNKKGLGIQIGGGVSPPKKKNTFSDPKVDPPLWRPYIIDSEVLSYKLFAGECI